MEFSFKPKNNKEEVKSEKSGGGISLIVLVFFIAVIVITLFLFISNKSIKSDNTKITNEIQEVNNEISEIKNDPKYNIYLLLKQNDNIMKKIDKYSKIPDFIEYLQGIEKANSGIKFEGFNYSNGTISTRAIVSKKDTGSYTTTKEAYQIVSNFIQGYRIKEKTEIPEETPEEGNTEQTSEEGNSEQPAQEENTEQTLEEDILDFDLEFINSFDGFDQIEFSVNLKLK